MSYFSIQQIDLFAKLCPVVNIYYKIWSYVGVRYNYLQMNPLYKSQKFFFSLEFNPALIGYIKSKVLTAGITKEIPEFIYKRK